MKNTQTLAVFDFDGTITNRDSVNDFLIWKFGLVRFFLSYFFMLPLIVLYFFKIVKNSTIKKAQIFFFLRKRTLNEFIIDSHNYAEKRLHKIVRQDAISTIKSHHQKGHTLIIISSSFPYWIEAWATNYSFHHVIGTKLSPVNGLINTSALCKNCYGEQKVNSLRELYPNLSDFTIYVYGDSDGDKELLEIASYPNYKIFNNLTQKKKNEI
jgi:phosphatidylglycerophosphatase C